MSRRPWTEEEDAFIREHYASMTAREIAESLGRTVPSVEDRLNKAGLRKIAPWTEEERAFVTSRYASTPNKELARAVGRTVPAVSTFARALGLRKSAAYMAGAKERATAALRAASRSKPTATTAHIRALERCRIALGLPQKTRMKIGREPEAKGKMRRWLMSCGYVMMDGDRLTLYYTPDTARRPRSEVTAARHGIRIKPIEDYGQNG